ncbi:MAG: hypothetical protein ABIE55_02035 [Candidatus Aenigmatarchaeota archaeon]
MNNIFDMKRTILLISGLFFITVLIVFADPVPDPIIQYNQTGAPVVVYGETPSGNYDDLNILGEGLTYNIPEDFRFGNYLVEIWHNSTQIVDGNINFINVTINFTSNVSDDYSIQIYDWFNSNWVSSDCDSGNVLADTPTRWWCNKTTNPMNYNSSDRVVRIRINSTGNADPGLLVEDYIQYYIGYPSYLEVNLTNPDTTATLNVIQNKTFSVNATIVCKDGPCGEVNGTIMYNLSSSDPDIPINTTEGDKPFYIQDSPANAMRSCGTMKLGDFCQLNWTINATGNVNSDWKINVLFNSSYIDMLDNSTNSATITINDCTVDMTVQWPSINFGSLIPGTTENGADGNDGDEYNITVNPGSCNLDFYINGTNLTNTTYNSLIPVNNVTWSNTTNDYAESFELSYTINVLKLDVPENTNITTWYWINVPAVYAGYYNGTVFIWGVENGENPP